MAKVTSKQNLDATTLENRLIVGLNKTGEIVAETASALAPVDTGRLSKSYTHSIPVVTGKLRASVKVGSNVHYAPHQEFGTVHQSGKAHLRPALRDETEAVVDILKQAVLGNPV